MCEVSDVDLEVEQILQNKDFQQLPSSQQVSIGSPVLNSIASDKKALLGRRRTFRNKSRVRTKLTDRFKTSKDNSENVQHISDNTFENQNNFLANIINDKLARDSEINCVLERSNCKTPDKFCFKKPLSPSCFVVLSPKLKARNQAENSLFKNEVPINNQHVFLRTEFKTALNTNNQISCPTSPQCTYNYQNIHYKSTKESISEASEIKNSCLTEETEEQKNDWDDLSLTQEIFLSGITNSQISNAFDNALDNIKSESTKNNFLGFNDADIYETEKFYNRFVDCANVIIGHNSSFEKIFIPRVQNSNKRKLGTLFLPPCKKKKEELIVQPKEQIKNLLPGFSTASGNKINISPNSLQITKGIFDNIEKVSNNFQKPFTTQFENNNKQTVSGIKNNILKPLTIQENCAIHNNNNSNHENRHQLLRKLTKDKLNFFDNLLTGSESENISDAGFLKPTINRIEFQNNFTNIDNIRNVPGPSGFKPFKKPNQLKQQIMNNSEESGLYRNSEQQINSIHTSGKSTSNQISKSKLTFFDQLIQAADSSGEPDNVLSSNVLGFPNSVKTFQNLSNSNRLPTNTSCQLKREISEIKGIATNLKHSDASVGFTTASGKSVQVTETSLKRAVDVFKNLGDCSYNMQKPLPMRTSLRQNNFITPLRGKNTVGFKRRKRFGGIIACKQIPVSDEQLKKARLLFNEDFSSLSPIRPFQVTSNTENPNFHSTPVRVNNYSTPNRSTSFSSGKFMSTPLTPIRPDVNNSQERIDSLLESTIKNLIIEDTRVILTSPTKGSGADLLDELEKQKKSLMERLKIIEERQKVISEMQHERPKNDQGKPRRGILFQKKNANKISPLKVFVENMKPGEDIEESMLFYVTPKNAANLHFKESSSVIHTKDNAVILPNNEDRVGLTEISQGFKNMPGVEERLIPNGWMKNHYKWIVWKLASYERVFPKKLKGALTIENVVQQLKYRYDREIDRAERPALRRIYEKDDAPQKRLILCVSDIKQIGNEKFELELTDGWYPLRTVIDEPLCAQVMTSKIKIGTKLIISDATIMNCEGCYPLEASDLTYLKINYNCTRRAVWYAKLGYQPVPRPFPIKIRTAHELGGALGEISICIVRCYPLNYLEKNDIGSVWYNEKAEQRRAQEWDNLQNKKLEQFQEDIRSKLSQHYMKECSTAQKTITVTDFSNITSPKELLEIIENSNDPETMEQKLSSSQKQSLIEYKRDIFLKIQQEMLSQFNNDIEKLSKAKRAVSVSLKLVVVDINDNPNRFYNFFIWHPTETHLDMMAEGSCILVSNALPRKNKDLTSGNRTVFKPLQETVEMSIIFKRKITEIADINELKFPSDFREFDTVGLVVDVIIDDSYQEVWLCNSFGRLLVVKIFEGPTTCSLLDSLKRGQPTSACNLIFHSFRDNIVHATGNHFTIFSCYSQHKHLVTGLEKFKNCLPQKLENLLEDCDKRIHGYRCLKSNYFISNTSRPNKNYDSDEDTLISSQLSKTDIALSMIDVDKIK